MERITFSICARCRVSSSKYGVSDGFRRGLSTTPVQLRQGHSKRSSVRAKTPRKQPMFAGPDKSVAPLVTQPYAAKKPPPSIYKGYLAAKTERPPEITLKELPYMLKQRVRDWITDSGARQQLEAFGIPWEEITPLLKGFVNALDKDKAFRAEDYEEDDLIRMAQALADRALILPKRFLYTRLFYAWATNPEFQGEVVGKLAKSQTIEQMRRLKEATDCSYPAEWFPRARARKRKIIMHVGPTNSGKTHNALRALAAARQGCYCGPLRLLAHEIWYRLNQGQIIPLGVEPQPELEPDDTSNLDVDNRTGPVVTKHGLTSYVRECNLLTGEEQKVVSENAGLISCTVEMVNMFRSYDVAVLDEIQLIADPERGSAWTTALLALDAKEVHLCGEDTAIPLIEKIVSDLGDELIVNRYERLTPLVVAEKSLNGDFSKILPGDCVVTFSRSNIFAVKAAIEQKTGLRCAVAYGRLPPELRTEQAAKFNDSFSGYDVMVGSDAIGMGLNLKIKRIVFEACHKWDGNQDVLLSVSQMKQIAGRAGRYGLHGDDSGGGIATTLHEADLPVLRKALETPIASLSSAMMPILQEQLIRVNESLPPHSGLTALFTVFPYISNVRAPYQLFEHSKLSRITTFLDLNGRDMTFTERHLFVLCPISWQDSAMVHVVEKVLNLYRRDGKVEIADMLEGEAIWRAYEDVAGSIEAGEKPLSTPLTLQGLETLHKVLTMYLWLHYRAPVAFPDLDQGMKLKAGVEKGMEWALMGLPTSRRAGRLEWVNKLNMSLLEKDTLAEEPAEGFGMKPVARTEMAGASA